MSAVKMMVKGGVSLARALQYCGLSRRAYYKKRQVERGIGTAVAKAVTRISSEWPTYGTRMLAHMAACETGRPVSRKQAGRICKILDARGQNRRKTGNRGVESQKAAVRPLGAVPAVRGRHYVHPLRRRRVALLPHVVDVPGRKWISYVFSPPSARPASAVQPVLDAAGGLSPDQIRGIRVRCDNGL